MIKEKCFHHWWQPFWPYQLQENRTVLTWLTSNAITIYANSIRCSRIAMLVTKSSTINTISASYLSTPIPHPKIKIKYIMHKNKVMINKPLHKCELPEILQLKFLECLFYYLWKFFAIDLSLHLPTSRPWCTEEH